MNYSRENDELRQRIVELEHKSPELDDQMQALLGPNLQLPWSRHNRAPQKFLFGRNQCRVLC